MCSEGFPILRYAVTYYDGKEFPGFGGVSLCLGFIVGDEWWIHVWEFSILRFVCVGFEGVVGGFRAGFSDIGSLVGWTKGVRGDVSMVSC